MAIVDSSMGSRRGRGKRDRCSRLAAGSYVATVAGQEYRVERLSGERQETVWELSRDIGRLCVLASKRDCLATAAAWSSALDAGWSEQVARAVLMGVVVECVYLQRGRSWVVQAPLGGWIRHPEGKVAWTLEEMTDG